VLIATTTAATTAQNFTRNPSPAWSAGPAAADVSH
jgi:hypothetical protein